MDTNHEQPKSAKDRILERIRQGERPMRSKAYFVARIIALALVALAVLAISIFLANFILFGIRINSHDALLGFGPRGLLLFVRMFPWPLLIIDIGLIILLEWLLRKFRFGYKSPVLYLFIGIIALSASAGFLIDRETDVNDRLLNRADRHELPGFDDVFEGARHAPPPGTAACHCTITAINGNILQATGFEQGTTTLRTLIVRPEDPVLSTLNVGDTIFAIGDEDGATIHVFGIKLDSEIKKHAPVY
jgi:hypothetical protein